MPLQKPTRVGRPTSPKKHVHASVLPIHLDPEDFELVEEAAKAGDVTVSEWILDAIEAKIRSKLEPKA